MFGMDIFNSSAFSAVSMTLAVQDIKFVPSFVRSLKLFTPKPIRTTTVLVERQNDSLALIPTTPRGSPRDRRGVDRRNVRNLETVRVAREHRAMADSFQNIRAFGTEDTLEAVQEEIAKHQAKLLRDHDLTMELHQLGAIQGVLLDADGSVIYDYFSEFGITPPSELGFNLTSRTSLVEYIRDNVIRPIMTALGGRWVPGARIVALCGDEFFDALTSHAEVRTTYLNWQAAADLRKGLGGAYGNFSFGEVEWVNYRGVAGTGVAIDTTDAKFVPVGIPDMFQVAYSPAEGLDFVNQLGQPIYSRLVPDPSTRREFVDIEVASYPLHICSTPEALMTGRVGS